MSITSCPGCGAPAEITERFTLASTDGPVAHVAVCCAGGHHYRMAADRLPADDSRLPAPNPDGHPVILVRDSRIRRVSGSPGGRERSACEMPLVSRVAASPSRPVA